MIGRKRRQKQRRERARLKKLEKQQAQQVALATQTAAPVSTAPVPTSVPVVAPAPAPLIIPRHPPGTTPPPNWNEAAYLAKHPDVAAGVKSGAIPSGLWHYLKSGQKEGRALAGLETLMSKRVLLTLLVLGVAVFLWQRRS